MILGNHSFKRSNNKCSTMLRLPPLLNAYCGITPKYERGGVCIAMMQCCIYLFNLHGFGGSPNYEWVYSCKIGIQFFLLVWHRRRSSACAKFYLTLPLFNFHCFKCHYYVSNCWLQGKLISFISLENHLN